MRKATVQTVLDTEILLVEMLIEADTSPINVHYRFNIDVNGENGHQLEVNWADSRDPGVIQQLQEMIEEELSPGNGNNSLADPEQIVVSPFKDIDQVRVTITWPEA